MKKSGLILLILTFFLTTQAQQFSQLNVSMWDNSPISIILNGEWYDTPSPQFTINNVMPGNYELDVYEHAPGTTARNLVYSGFIKIPASATVSAEVTAYNVLNVNIHPISNRRVVNSNNHYQGNRNNPRNNGYRNAQNSGHRPQYGHIMSPQSYMQLKQTIQNASFESSKEQIAKQAISSNHVSAEQVAGLLQLFTYESTKVELAKFAYPYTRDKENYYLVNNAFSFSSSVRELNDFIAGYNGY